MRAVMLLLKLSKKRVDPDGQQAVQGLLTSSSLKEKLKGLCHEQSSVHGRHGWGGKGMHPFICDVWTGWGDFLGNRRRDE
jgi:hypothetical protein